MVLTPNVRFRPCNANTFQAKYWINLTRFYLTKSLKGSAGGYFISALGLLNILSYVIVPQVSLIVPQICFHTMVSSINYVNSKSDTDLSSITM